MSNVKTLSTEKMIENLFNSNLDTDTLMATVKVLKSAGTDAELLNSGGADLKVSRALGVNFLHTSGDIYVACGLEELDTKRVMKNMLKFVISKLMSGEGKKTHIIENILDSDYEGKAEFIMFIFIKGLASMVPSDNEEE